MPQGAVPFPFGQCRICSDKATGVHYGVTTCEGCKGFYKRSISKGDQYRCYFGGCCAISPENRNRCKACRFQKCLQLGMAVEAVKMGRIPKLEKEKALEEAATMKTGDTQDPSPALCSATTTSTSTPSTSTTPIATTGVTSLAGVVATGSTVDEVVKPACRKLSAAEDEGLVPSEPAPSVESVFPQRYQLLSSASIQGNFSAGDSQAQASMKMKVDTSIHPVVKSQSQATKAGDSSGHGSSSTRPPACVDVDGTGGSDQGSEVLRSASTLPALGLGSQLRSRKSHNGGYQKPSSVQSSDSRLTPSACQSSRPMDNAQPGQSFSGAGNPSSDLDLFANDAGILSTRDDAADLDQNASSLSLYSDRTQSMQDPASISLPQQRSGVCVDPKGKGNSSASGDDAGGQTKRLCFPWNIQTGLTDAGESCGDQATKQTAFAQSCKKEASAAVPGSSRRRTDTTAGHSGQPGFAHGYGQGLDDVVTEGQEDDMATGCGAGEGTVQEDCGLEGGDHGTLSPGLVKLLFRQMMEEGREEERDKLLKTLARSCTVEPQDTNLDDDVAANTSSCPSYPANTATTAPISSSSFDPKDALDAQADSGDGSSSSAAAALGVQAAAFSSCDVSRSSGALPTNPVFSFPQSHSSSAATGRRESSAVSKAEGYEASAGKGCLDSAREGYRSSLATAGESYPESSLHAAFSSATNRGHYSSFPSPSFAREDFFTGLDRSFQMQKREDFFTGLDRSSQMQKREDFFTGMDKTCLMQAQPCSSGPGFGNISQYEVAGSIGSSRPGQEDFLLQAVPRSEAQSFDQVHPATGSSAHFGAVVSVSSTMNPSISHHHYHHHHHHHHSSSYYSDDKFFLPSPLPSSIGASSFAGQKTHQLLNASSSGSGHSDQPGLDLTPPHSSCSPALSMQREASQHHGLLPPRTDGEGFSQRSDSSDSSAMSRPIHHQHQQQRPDSFLSSGSNVGTRSGSCDLDDLDYLCREQNSRNQRGDLSGSSDASSSPVLPVSGESGGGKMTLNPDALCDPQMRDVVAVLDSSTFTIFELAHRRSLRDKYLKIKREDKTAVNVPPTVSSHVEMYSLIMESMGKINQKIIKFCQMAPGFASLDTSDQKSLLKRAYYDIWMLTSSEFFVDGESYLVTQDEVFYVRRHMEKIIGQAHTQTFHLFAQQFNALGLTHLEVAIMCCIQLTAPSHDQQTDLTDVREIQKLNSFYLDLLVVVVTLLHPDTSSRMLVDIFRLIPLLAEINRLQRELIAAFSVTKPPSASETSTSSDGLDGMEETT